MATTPSLQLHKAPLVCLPRKFNRVCTQSVNTKAANRREATVLGNCGVWESATCSIHGERHLGLDSESWTVVRTHPPRNLTTLHSSLVSETQ